MPFVANMAQIAAKAQTSISTVSRVLNNRGSVKNETATRVLEAANELGYSLPRSMNRNGRTRLIGLIVPDLLNPFFGLLVDGIIRNSADQSYGCILASPYSDDETRLRELALHDVNGVIWIPSGGMKKGSVPSGRFDKPIVYLDRCPNNENTHSVTCDNHLGALQATKYLLKLGHRRIVYLGGPEHVDTDKARYSGFCAAFHESDMEPVAALTMRADFDQTKAYAKIHQLLQNDAKFTAVFSADDVMAFGAMRAITESGLRIPDDISLIGFDDIPLASSIALTTVSQPFTEMASISFHLLYDAIEGRVKQPRHINLSPSLVIRSSCGGVTAKN